MFRYEIQFLGRTQGDYDRQLRAVGEAALAGKVAFRSYYFAGIKGLVVLVESEADRQAALRAVPRADVVGAWEIAPAAGVAA